MGEVLQAKSLFSAYKRGGKVYTRLSQMFQAPRLIPIIERKVVPDSIVYSDCWRGYNVLDVSDFHHFRIDHSKLFADRHNHINGIENFCNQAKRHMRKFTRCSQGAFWAILEGM